MASITGPIKVAVRDRGEWIVGYLASTDEKDMIEVARIGRAVAQNKQCFRMFVEMLKTSLSEFMSDQGLTPSEWKEIRAPRLDRN